MAFRSARFWTRESGPLHLYLKMSTPEEKEDAPRKTRERKATKHFEVVVKEKKEIELGGGSGTKLGAIPVILYYINHLNGGKILLFLLDKMLYTPRLYHT